jgi:serine/threonine protein kinase
MLLSSANQRAEAHSEFSETVMMPIEPPESIGQIGRYSLKYPIGEGGLGTVYAANDPLLSRVIAIKTLNVSLDPQQRDAFNTLFLNEARAAAGLSHPHIVTVFDAGISNDKAYIAMELLQGRDLRQLRKDGWRPSPAQAALIVRRVADALAYAHNKGVIHRDIKPANIFMVGRTQPRVLDFGIAHLTKPKGRGASSASESQEVAAGSPYYMSPEQVRQEVADKRTDVFSLGVVLYELLTDTKPFNGKTLDDITQAVLNHKPPMAHEVDPRIPEALSLLVARAMEKSPDLRFRSARLFSQELRQWLRDHEEAHEGTENTVPTALTTAASSTSPGVRRKDGLAPTRGRRVLGLSVGLGALAALMGGLVLWQTLPRETALLPSGTAASVAPASFTSPAPAAVPPAIASSDSTAAAPAVAPSPQPSEPAQNAGSSPALSDGGGEAVQASQQAAAPPDASAPRPREPASAQAPRANAKEKKTKDAKPQREAKAAPAAKEDSATAEAEGVVGIGYLRLAISPWGQVEINGKVIGNSPLPDLKLPEGKHQVTIRNADFPPFSATITIAPNQTFTIRHKFGS